MTLMDDAVRSRIEAGQGTPEDAATVLVALDAQAALTSTTYQQRNEAMYERDAAEAREARLREALETIDGLAADWNNPTPSAGFASIQTVARAALSPEAET